MRSNPILRQRVAARPKEGKALRAWLRIDKSIAFLIFPGLEQISAMEFFAT